jgi:regulator of RNase E activity RraA
MSPTNLTQLNRERLKQVSIATISTCLYREGLKHVTPHGIMPVKYDQSRMVGEAFTVRFVPMREDVGGHISYGAAGNVHQRAFEECPQGFVLVMDTRGETRGCCCGDLLIGRLKARGCAGVVTDGGFRDTPDIAALDFPAFQQRPAPAPSFGRLHAVELNVPVGCSDVAIYPGDVVVGDAEGIVVIPNDLANRIAEEAWAQTQYDTFAAEAIAGGRSVIGLYPATPESQAEFNRWQGSNNGR